MKLFCATFITIISLIVLTAILIGLQYAYAFGPVWLVKVAGENSTCSPAITIPGVLMCISIIIFNIMVIRGIYEEN